MEAYAVIETGGKQHRVQKGDVIKIERIEGEAGSKVTLSPVLAISDGASLKVGTPVIEKAKVTAQIFEQMRDKKVVAFKKKRRKGYKRKVGHRQEITQVKIVSLS
ncbi:MAG TPA: 50S ribosomal protein L21 [Kiritimatiellia bacterium]|nr:50S ribosomal protein L21 [Kiritimatiellia bacterium]